MQRHSYIKCDLSIQWSLFVTTACEVNKTPLMFFTETAIRHADTVVVVAKPSVSVVNSSVTPQ